MKENKVLKFELSPQNLRIKNVLRNDFVAIDVYAISDIYPNRNNSHFTSNSLRDALPSFYNKPALGAFNVGKNDFKAHEMELRWDNELQQDYFDFTNGRCEVPLGVIRNEDLVEVVELNGQTWVHFTCVLWAKYCYRQVKRLLKDKRKKISVEVEVIESHEDENGVEIIDKFTFDGFSLLGEDVTEAIPNAHLTILDKVNDAFYQKQEKCLSFAYKGLDNNSFDFALDENDIKNNKDSFADNDSGEIVDNEKVDEITMEHGEEESQEMTYEEKMALLNSALGENTWASDLDETHVYCFNQEEKVAYKVPYSFAEDAEGHMTANVNMDEAVKVVRSWKEFSEENPDDAKDEDNKETESVEENKKECSTDNQETEACDDKKEESAENKEECSEENKKCESEDADGCGECENESAETECKFDEHKEVPENDGEKKVESAEGCETCAEEDDNDSDEEPKDEDKKENESAEENKEDECNMSAEENAEENKEEMSSDATVVTPDAHITIDGSEKGEKEDSIADIKTDIMKEHDDGSLKGTGVYAVGEENLTADELYAKFNDLQAKYDALFAQFTAKQNDEFYAFACSLIDAEEDLTSENNSAIKATFSESCKNGAYSSNEDVQNAVEHSLADALYAQRKMSKAKKAETFSVSINKSQNNSVIEETLTNAQELKNLVQRLRRI